MSSDGARSGDGVPRRDVVLAAAASASALVPGLGSEPAVPVQVKGVDRYRVYDPAFEGVRVALSVRKTKFSPAYVQGISGAGFRMGGPCPCAPTCTAAMSQSALVRLLGYSAEELNFTGRADTKERVGEIVARIKSEVRAGRPVMVFHAFTSAEWDVVCGYDDATNEFLGRGGYGAMLGKDYVRADQGRMATCGDICPPIGAIVIGEPTGPFDATAAEIAALREAARHARDKARKDYPFDGLAAYDKWADHWRAADAKPDWLRDGYISAVYSSTHAAGADFLKQMARKHRRAGAPLREAAKSLSAEAAELHGILARLFPGEDKPGPTPEAARAEMPAAVARARAHYSAMADALDRALPLL